MTASVNRRLNVLTARAKDILNNPSLRQICPYGPCSQDNFLYNGKFSVTLIGMG